MQFLFICLLAHCLLQLNTAQSLNQNQSLTPEDFKQVFIGLTGWPQKKLVNISIDYLSYQSDEANKTPEPDRFCLNGQLNADWVSANKDNQAASSQKLPTVDEFT